MRVSRVSLFNVEFPYFPLWDPLKEGAHTETETGTQSTDTGCERQGLRDGKTERQRGRDTERQKGGAVRSVAQT